MATSLKIIAFSALVIGLFVWLATYFTELSGGAGFAAASGDISVESGEAVFWNRGKCFTCHSLGALGSAVRGPNLGVASGKFDEPIGVRAASRKPGMSAIEFIVESLYDPNLVVTRGFPKGVMTPMNRPPILLSDEEIRSVVLYLLQKSEVDTDPQVARQIERAQRAYASADAVTDTAGPTIQLPKGYKSAGKREFERVQCRQCHIVRGIEWKKRLKGGVGPELTGIGAIQSQQYLFESIINPNAVVLPDPSPEQKYTEGGKSKMPEWGHALTVQQVADIVAFLLTLKESPPPGPPTDADLGPPGTEPLDGGGVPAAPTPPAPEQETTP